MQMNKLIRLAGHPPRPIMSFNTFIQACGGLLTGRYTGPYGGDVPVHETLGISLQFIIGAGRDNAHEQIHPAINVGADLSRPAPIYRPRWMLR